MTASILCGPGAVRDHFFSGCSRMTYALTSRSNPGRALDGWGMHWQYYWCRDNSCYPSCQAIAWDSSGTSGQ